MDAPFPDWLVPEWQKFFSTTSYLRGDRDFPEIFQWNLYPLQRRKEIQRVIDLLLPIKPRVVMEIGTDKCATIYHWVQSLPSVKRAIGVEFRGTPVGDEFVKAFPDVDFLWKPGSSYAPQCVEDVRAFLGEDKIDFLFIDGDKDKFDRDFDLYWPMVSDGGVVAFHDIFDNGLPMQNAFLSKAKLGSRVEVVIDTSECDEIKASDLLRGVVSHEVAARNELNARYAVPGHDHWLRVWPHRSCGYGLVFK